MNIIETISESLMENITKAKEQIAEAIREATLQGEFAEAQRLLLVSKDIEELSKQVQAMRERWLQREETPEEKLAKSIFAGEAGERKRRRREPVDRTPQSEYCIPILESLVELGGRGRAEQVFEIVYEKMKSRLKPDDLKKISYGIEVRWRNTAAWERYDMVRDGLLCSDSPRGIWEISEEGKQYLEQGRQRDVKEGEQL